MWIQLHLIEYRNAMKCPLYVSVSGAIVHYVSTLDERRQQPALFKTQRSSWTMSEVNTSACTGSCHTHSKVQTRTELHFVLTLFCPLYSMLYMFILVWAFFKIICIHVKNLGLGLRNLLYHQWDNQTMDQKQKYFQYKYINIFKSKSYV